MAKKTKYIRAVGHAIVGNTGSPSTTLAPGERVEFDDSLASHKEIEREVTAGLEPNLEIVEIDLKAEANAEEERQEQLKVAEKIAQEEALKQQQAQRVRDGEGTYDPGAHSVADVLAYLKSASPTEVKRVQELEANTSRSSKQVADFQPRETEGGEGGTTEGAEGTSAGQDTPESADPGGTENPAGPNSAAGAE